MSVLQSKRTTSRTEYINTAKDIYIETLTFLTKLSAKYSRLIAHRIADLAGDVLDICEKANHIYPSGEDNKRIRKEMLLNARASLMALDVRLTTCYELMNRNPQGCFEKEISASTAKEKISKMADKLGVLIDKEKNLITAVMESDRKRK